ncbi:MAG TPA: adenylate/guanylate cyclase domain-containing protein [Alphaproteobacteria bacterium]|nr:adenylate/guanylate cyclase domain-containing protein [Alphaproteobacteria bacterium]
MFARLGVRGRLLLSFFGISAFAVIAAATAMYSFLEVGKALERIIEFRVPSAIASVQLSRQAERIVAAAPALLTVTTAPEHERVSGMIFTEVDRLDSLLNDLERRGTDPTYVEDGRRGVHELRANLDNLHTLIAERLAAGNRKTALLLRLGETHRATQRLLGPGLLLVESSLSRLHGAMAEANPNAKERSELITSLVDSLAASPPLQRAQSEILTINGALLQASTAERVTDLPILALPLERSLDALTKLIQGLEPDLRSSLLARVEEFRSFVSGPDSIVEARRRELDLIAERFATSNRKTALLLRLGETHRATQRLLGPGLLLVESNLTRLRGAMADAGLNAKERSELITSLVNSLAASPSLQRAQSELLTINGALLQTSTTEHVTDLPVLALPLERSLHALTKLGQELEAGLRSSLLARVEEFRSFVSGPDSIVETRRRELGLIAEQLAASNRKTALLLRLGETHRATQRLLGPGLLLVEAGLSRLRGAMADASLNAKERSELITNLVDSLAASPPFQRAQIEELSINGALLQAATAEHPTDLPLLALPLERSLDALTKLAQELEPDLRSSLLARVQEFRSFVSGPDSIVETRRRELDLIAEGRRLLAQNAEVSSRLTNIVSGMVSGAEQDITRANFEALSTQRLSTAVLIAVVALTIISSALIVWLYVGRNIIARLTELSACMESVAGGDLKVHLPSTESDDEIGRMTKALTVFRDTAVEIEESNLREIAQTRQRLLDAIESISEGFCYYDSNDRLVVANNRYRSLIYPGAEETVVEGMAFEKVIRTAAERGYVKDAEDRIDEWVAERLAQHRQPGAPYILQGIDGRWVMVGERRTGDGGTVAIYSDITELKQREKELSEKSKSMEQLSGQIAKYLSPQIYESIFTGKREVKVASHRRKLSIFFSDIAGFTETAEQLESEDLTKLLNHYLTEMSEIALVHGATIDKYVGDAIVIFFGDPETRGVKEDALACVKMAIAMRQKMAELQGTWRDSGIANPLRCRIGINTGFCTVGNFGSEDRMDYTIIGSGVNLASRLESASAPGEILISYETFALVKDEILCKKFGEITVKGVSHPVETYQVVDTYENLGREREVIQDEFPNYSLTIKLEALSPEERNRAVASLSRALDKLGQREDVAAKTAA